jgi:hypothetical protein
MSGDERYIWIARWNEFQHYAPARDRGPAWIKDYTAQLDDGRYLRLSDRQRALLRDIRDVFAVLRGQLPDDTRMITRRRGSQTRRVDLEALSDAGFIEFVSRPALERHLEELYASHAPARSQEQEQEEEAEKEQASHQEGPAAAPAAAALLEQLNRLGVNGALRAAAIQDPERAQACALKAEREATTNPAGYFRQLLESGDWPTTPKPKPARPTSGTPLDPLAAIKTEIRNGAIPDRDYLDAEIRGWELHEHADELHALLEETAA